MTGSFSPYLLPAGAFVLGLLFLWISSWLRGRTGLSSSAEVLASDTSQGRVAKIRDPKSGLVGQPDYILRERVWFRKKIVPVELKPMRRSRTLYESDEMQVVAYLILLRAKYGRKAARYGYVRYRDVTFRVRLTREREQRCLKYAEAVRAARTAEDVLRSHQIPGRCAACALRRVCEDSLVS